MSKSKHSNQYKCLNQCLICSSAREMLFEVIDVSTNKESRIDLLPVSALKESKEGAF